MSEQSQLIARLRAYNAWRRGGDGEQPEPKQIGIDIDAAVQAIESAEAQLRIAAGLLDDAAEDVEHWGGYAGSYFQEVHMLSYDIKKYQDGAAALRQILAQSKDEECAAT